MNKLTVTTKAELPEQPVWVKLQDIDYSVFTGAMTVLEALRAIVDAVNQTRQDMNTLVDYDNDFWEIVVNYINQQLTDFETANNTFYAKCDKRITDFINDETANREQFEQEMKALYDEFTAQITAQFNAFKTEITNKFDEFKNQITADFTDLQNRFDELNQKFTDLENAWAEFQQTINEQLAQKFEELETWKGETFAYFQGQYEALLSLIKNEIEQLIPKASKTQYGVVKVGDGIDVNDGVISVSGGGGYTLPAATASTLGGVKIGSGISVTPDGTISASGGQYTLPAATTDALGGVIVGDGLAVTPEGKISVTGGGGGVVNYDYEVKITKAADSGQTQYGTMKHYSTDTFNILVIDIDTNISLVSQITRFQAHIQPTPQFTNKNELLNSMGIWNEGNEIQPFYLNGTILGSYGTTGTPTNLATRSLYAWGNSNTDVVNLQYDFVVNGSPAGGENSFKLKCVVLTHKTPMGQPVNTSGLADQTVAGVVKSGGDVAISNGVLTINYPTASTTKGGVVKVGSTLKIQNGVLDVADGVIIPTDASIKIATPDDSNALTFDGLVDQKISVAAALLDNAQFNVVTDQSYSIADVTYTNNTKQLRFVTKTNGTFKMYLEASIQSTVIKQNEVTVTVTGCPELTLASDPSQTLTAQEIKQVDVILNNYPSTLAMLDSPVVLGVTTYATPKLSWEKSSDDGGDIYLKTDGVNCKIWGRSNGTVKLHCIDTTNNNPSPDYTIKVSDAENTASVQLAEYAESITAVTQINYIYDTNYSASDYSVVVVSGNEFATIKYAAGFKANYIEVTPKASGEITFYVQKDGKRSNQVTYRIEVKA